MEKEISIRLMQEHEIPELLMLIWAIVVFQGDTAFGPTERDLLCLRLGDRHQVDAITANCENYRLLGIPVHDNILLSKM